LAASAGAGPPVAAITATFRLTRSVASADKRGAFRKEDYPALLTIFEDGRKMPRTWEEWLKQAEKAEQKMEIQGYMTERVYIDPDTFPDWCYPWSLCTAF
jgi:hypothetical protein